MVSFKEANQARLAIKMNLSNFYWYLGSDIVQEDNDYSILIYVLKIDNVVKKTIPVLHNNVSIKYNLANVR